MAILWTPKYIDTLLWVDESTMSLDMDGEVEQWLDRSGNANHLSQTTQAYRPSMTASGINGLDVVTFVEANTDRIGVAYNFGTSVSIFHVQRTTDSQYILFGRGDTGVYAVCCHSGQTGDISGSFGSPTYFIDGVQTTIANRGAFYTLLHNRVAIVECVGASINWASFILSGYISSGWYFNGDVAEVIIVNGVISTDDRQKIEGYLAHKWGSAGYLASAHPYKNEAPLAPYNGYFSGYVSKLGGPVSRTLYSYRRDDGSLISSTTSSGDGYFYLETDYDGGHFIVCLDDDVDQFNLLGYDSMVPTTIS